MKTLIDRLGIEPGYGLGFPFYWTKEQYDRQLAFIKKLNESLVSDPNYKSDDNVYEWEILKTLKDEDVSSLD